MNDIEYLLQVSLELCKLRKIKDLNKQKHSRSTSNSIWEQIANKYHNKKCSYYEVLHVYRWYAENVKKFQTRINKILDRSCEYEDANEMVNNDNNNICKNNIFPSDYRNENINKQKVSINIDSSQWDLIYENGIGASHNNKRFWFKKSFTDLINTALQIKGCS